MTVKTPALSDSDIARAYALTAFAELGRRIAALFPGGITPERLSNRVAAAEVERAGRTVTTDGLIDAFLAGRRSAVPLPPRLERCPGCGDRGDAPHISRCAGAAIVRSYGWAAMDVTDLIDLQINRRGRIDYLRLVAAIPHLTPRHFQPRRRRRRELRRQLRELGRQRDVAPHR